LVGHPEWVLEWKFTNGRSASSGGMSKPVGIAVQLGAAWTVGAIALPAAVPMLLGAAFFGGMGPFGLIALVGVVSVLAYLIVVVNLTRAVSVLGGSVGGRVLWALLVMGGGTAGWALGWVVTDAGGLGVSRSPVLTFLLGGVPFALVAGLFLRGWQFRTTAVGLSVVLVGAGVVVLRHETPDELDSRMALNGVHRETSYAVAIPGYKPTDRDYGNGLGGGGFSPADPNAIPPDRSITIVAHDRLINGEQMCGQPTAERSELPWGDCVVEPDGLVYRHNEIAHGYQVPVGTLYVTVAGTPAVDRDLLRTAARSVHLATAAELGGNIPQTGGYYAATVPGYVAQAMGIPEGMMYMPADHTGSGAQAVSINLYVSYAQSDSICFETTQCSPDGDGLTYVRHADTHGFVVRRGEVDVKVYGGLRTDRALLRRAALDARPATDDELSHALPPLRPSSLTQRLRQWARRL
jgi:hypothetical protein